MLRHCQTARSSRAHAPLVAAAIAVCISFTIIGAASAQDFPSRPIRLLVGFTAGGPTDLPARFIADKLSTALGKPVVVENKPGAGSMLATQEMLSQPRDGHTLLACTYFDPVNTLLYRKARYRVSDIAPVSQIARYDYAIAASRSLPANDFKELVRYAKANPGKLNYGHLGIGSTQNFLAKKLEQIAGIEMTAIPFKGANDAVQEIVAGRLDLYIGPPLAVMPQLQAGHIKVLAVTGSERMASAPNVATLKESGYPLVAYAWLGICAATGTPQPIIDLLNSKIVPIINSSEYRALVEKSGSVAVASTPQELQAIINETVKDAAPTIDEFRLQLD
ncbi:MAG: tripartite tricarboxylate transporter substrate binding protein [Hyphomicrobiales bacterium]|nr:tripartite tricarboxylate transporter substrate binding protein [Hyphomicrobiales bacterium]